MLPVWRSYNVVRSIPFPRNSGITLRKWYSKGSVEDRYRKKLLMRAKQEGVTNVEQLKEKMREKIEQQRKEFKKNDPLRALPNQTASRAHNNKEFTKYRNPSKTKIQDTLSKQNSFKTLSSYLDIQKISKLSEKEIEYLWRLKWSTKDNSLSSVIPKDIFKKLNTVARQNPNFVLPLPRPKQDSDSGYDEMDKGMELNYIQWNFPGPETVHCMMTSLEEYKLHKQFARPHTTLEFHTELLQFDKNVVLMDGIVTPDCNISLQDAQLLLFNLQRFYGAMDTESQIAQERNTLLRQFTKGSSSFTVDKLIQLSESMQN